VTPVVPGVQGLITPVLSTGPVAIEALLAPEPVLPASEVVPAIMLADDGFWLAMAAVCWQAGLASGDIAMLCANAEAENAMPIATAAEKIYRDIRSSKISLPRTGARLTYLWRLQSQNSPQFAIRRFVIDN
jgi:hypothetical protein